MKIHAVIMAGGSGTRLWPLSRENYPKQFVKIFDGKSLLQLCLERNKNFEKITLIVGIEHRFIALEQAHEVGVSPEIIIEPYAKNTAPCAILAGLIGKKSKSDMILLLPADHYIDNIEDYADTVKEAANLAITHSVATIGIKPNTPHTGYGYIELGNHINEESFEVNKFVEKPNLKDAIKYLESKKYCWNSGMFLCRPEEILQLAKEFVPEMAKKVADSFDKGEKDLGFFRLEPNSYKEIKSDSIDYAIMEKASNIGLTKASFGWSDLGSFSSIWEMTDKDKDSNVKIGDVVTIESSANYVYSNNRLTALVGISDLVVINTEDSTLVAHKSRSEDVKKIVNFLNSEKRVEAKNSPLCYRPWGSYQTIDEGISHKVKRIMVKPGHKLSLQYHHKRSEHWVVVEGVAEVQVGDDIHILNENDSIYIHKLVKHRLHNIGETNLYLIEVQTGGYLGEDDIVRLTDVYGRK